MHVLGIILEVLRFFSENETVSMYFWNFYSTCDRQTANKKSKSSWANGEVEMKKSPKQPGCGVVENSWSIKTTCYVVLRRGLWEVGQLAFDMWRILEQGQARTQYSRDRREPVTRRGTREVREESKVHPGGALQTFEKMHSFVLDMMERHWQPWAEEWLTAYPLTLALRVDFTRKWVPSSLKTTSSLLYPVHLIPGTA